MLKHFSAVALVSFAFFAASAGGTPPAGSGAPEKSGCCSHHKGVCGCANGVAKCCDGSLSPSCGC